MAFSPLACVASLASVAALLLPRLAPAAALVLPPNMPVPRSGDLVSLEHVNLNVPSWDEELEHFWVDALGSVLDTRAPSVHAKNVKAGGESEGLMWINIGLQQIHMPVGEPENATQTVPGLVALAFPELDELVDRLDAMDVAYEDFRHSEDALALPEEDVFWSHDFIELQSPTGVRLRIHGSREADPWAWYGPREHLKPEVRGGAAEDVILPGLPGGLSIGVGMPYARFTVRHGAAAGILAFYEHLFDASTELLVRGGRRVGMVRVGAEQCLLFQEAAEHEELPPYDGHHVAVYVNNFADAYERAAALGLVYENPRFAWATYGSVEEALHHNEFRVLDLVDPKTGAAVHRLEHEIRSLAHPGFSCRELLPGAEAPVAAEL